MTSIKLDGMDELKKILDKLEYPDVPVKKGMDQYLKWVQGEVTPYANEWAANSEPGSIDKRTGQPRGSWYVRNTGGRYRRKRDDGVSRYNTSQQMSKRWKFYARASRTKFVQGFIENKATYSDYVQGEKQVGWAARAGWKRVDEFVQDTKAQATKRIKKQIDKVLAGRRV